MRTGIFKRIFILYGVILVLAALATEFVVTRAIRTDHINLLRDSLAVQAALIARDLPFRHPVPLDAHAAHFKGLTGARVTVLAPDGRVLGDSDHDSRTMDNHRDREEVRQALGTGQGMAVRHSGTLDADLLYVAVRAAQDGPPGIVRLSVPLTEVDASIDRLRVRVLAAMGMLLLATGLFSLWQIERLRRLTVRIRDFAAAVSSGDLDKRLHLDNPGEYGEIAGSLNTMAAELQQSTSAAEEERRRLAVILSSIPDALLIGDERGVIRLASAASAPFFGNRTLVGRQFLEIVRDSDFVALLERARTECAPVSDELVLEGAIDRHCVAQVSPLSFAEGELSGLVAIFHDITRLKQLEQVRTDFVANLSHEIRTPITAIQGFAETLLDGALEDREHGRAFVATIKDNSERIARLVDDLMTLSRIELGAVPLEMADIAFEDVAEAVLALLKGRADEKGLSLAVEMPAGSGPVRADRDRLLQIMTNLVDNAVKFTDAGGVTFGLTEEDGRQVLFVRDTGIGIPEKHLARLGERFYRVDTARSRSMGGTGLGLAIVKHLVKAHGWQMRIESSPGKGTTVKVILSSRAA